MLPKLKYNHGTGKARIWELFKQTLSYKGKRVLSNLTIHGSTGLYRYGARIWEINQDLKGTGWRIRSQYINRGYYFYILERSK